MKRLLVGLTGGMASGKSTVAQLLREHGCQVFDADRLVAELYAPDEAGAAAVAKLFGSDFLDAAGAVDKPRLAKLIFADSEARQQLEAAVHPLVRQRFAKIAAEATGVVVYEATLLVESGAAANFDLVLSVEAEAATRLRRAIARGLDPAAARARLSAQGDGSERRAGADLLLQNNGGMEELREKVAALAAEWWGKIDPQNRVPAE